MHSFVSCLMHCVFATRERRPVIKPKLQQRLWPYLGGIARENKMRALIVGGVEDHVDVLLSIMTWSAPNLKSLCRPWRGLNGPVMAVLPSVETLGYSRDVPPGQIRAVFPSLMQPWVFTRADSFLLT